MELGSEMSIELGPSEGHEMGVLIRPALGSELVFDNGHQLELGIELGFFRGDKSWEY